MKFRVVKKENVRQCTQGFCYAAHRDSLYSRVEGSICSIRELRAYFSVSPHSFLPPVFHGKWKAMAGSLGISSHENSLSLGSG